MSTTNLRSPEPSPCSDHAALNMNGLVELLAGHTASDNGKPSQVSISDGHAEERSEKAMVWLLNYMAKAWTLLTAEGSPIRPGDQQKLPEQKPTDQKPPENQLVLFARPTSADGES